MAYQTGTATSASNLLSTVQTFAQANGFTLSGSVLSAGGSHTKLEADTRNIDHLASDIGNLSYEYIGLSGALDSGFTTGLSPTYITTLPSSCCFLVPTSEFPVTYHLFAFNIPDQIFCMVEHGAGYHTWFCFGNVLKSSSLYTGGNFLAASYSSFAVNQSRGFTPRDVGFIYGSPNTRPGYGGFFNGGRSASTSSGMNSFIYSSIDSLGWNPTKVNDSYPYNSVSASPKVCHLIHRQPNEWNSQTVLLSLDVIQPTATTYMDLGSFNNFRLLRNDFLSDGEIITIGSDKWKTFPICRKDVTYRSGFNDCEYYSALYAADHPNVINSPAYHGPRNGTFGFAIKYDGP